MKKHMRAFAGLMLFSLTPSMVLAQSMPDEVDHVRYRNILQGLQGQLADAKEYLAKLEAERGNLRQEIERMSYDRRQLPARNDELNRNIQARVAQDAALENEIRSLTTTVERISQDLSRLDAQVEQLRESWRQEEGRRAAMDNDLRRITDDVRRLRAQLDREVGEERESMALLDRIEGELQVLTDRRADLANQHRARSQRHQAEQRDLPNVRRQAGAAATQLQNAQNQLAPADIALNTLKTDLAAREAELAQANAAVAPYIQKVETAQADLKTSTDALAALEKSTSDAEANIKSMEQRKASATTQMTSLESTRASLTSQLAAAQADLDAKNLAASQATQKLQIDQAALAEAQKELREAAQRGDRGAMAELSRKVRNLENVVKASQAAAATAGQVASEARTVVQQREAALAATNTQITELQNFLSTVDASIASEREKIATNAPKIAALKNEVATKRQVLQAAETELTSVSSDRNRLTQLINQLRPQVAQAQTRRDQLAAEVQRLSADSTRLATQVREMETSLASFQQDMQRLENHAAQVGRDIQIKSAEADRERRVLARIREDRVRVQQQVAQLDQTAQTIARDLDAQERIVRGIEGTLRNREAERTQLASYLQRNRQDLDSNLRSQGEVRRVLEAERTELARNTERLATIEREFGNVQNRIGQLNQEIPVVGTQISTLSNQVTGADGQYRTRLSLFERYLGEARALGSSRGAGLGVNDGKGAGQTLASTTANRLGVPNGSEEGRFEALLRGFVRGEIAGFNTGRSQGLSSSADAARGTQEGTATGTREARDHAEQVLKPRYYSAEFTRRLNDPEVRDEVVMKLAAVAKFSDLSQKSQKSQRAADIPVLTASEISQSQSIRTSLDERILAAGKELSRLREEQTRLSNAQSVYLAPADLKAPINAKSCEGVYKNVAEFIQACQDSFKADYSTNFLSNHRETFMANYTASFRGVIAREVEAGVQRDFAANYKEAEAVARTVGVAVGKEEVYQERFAAARASAYQSTLATEDARVNVEATRMVDELFAVNGVAMLTESPILASKDRFGVAPGAAVTLNMILKNAGAVSTAEGAIKVRIIEASPVLVPTRTIAPVRGLPARKIVKTNADFGFKIADGAMPGQKARLVAEITYPGHDYVAQRVERIEVEEVLGLNPSAAIDVSFDTTPTVSGFLGSKKHDVGINLTAAYKGLSKGYEVSLEEVGTNFASFVDKDDVTKVLGQGQSEKLVLTYKLAKAARGKDVTLKVVVRYNGKVLEERTLNIKPQ